MVINPKFCDDRGGEEKGMKTNMPNWMLDFIHQAPVNEEPFILASGQKSRFFIDIKGAALDKDTRYKLADALTGVITQSYNKLYGYRAIPPGIAGIELGGAIVALSLQSLLWAKESQLYVVRKSRHATGRGYGMEGPYERTSVVLIDDVVTTGRSFLNAANIARGDGLHIAMAVAVIDRGGGKAISEVYPFYSLWTFEE